MVLRLALKLGLVSFLYFGSVIPTFAYVCQTALPPFPPPPAVPPAPIYDTWVYNATACNATFCTAAPAVPPPAGGIQSISNSGIFYKLCCCIAFRPPAAGAVLPADMKSKAVWTALGLLATEPEFLVADAVSLVLGIVGGICLLLLISGGFKYATSHGSPDAVMDAKNTITAALTGLAVIVFAVLILGTLGVNVFGLPGFGWNATNQLITPN